MRSYISEYPGWFVTNQHNLNCIYFLNELEKIMNNKSLYQRLGGYDGISAFTNDLHHVYKQTINWAVSGRIEEMMV